jgi:N6-adenosine-specific RNA methylase IME4
MFDRRPVEKAVMDYPTWSLEKIRHELPIQKLADPGGTHIYLWVTHRFLPAGLDLFKAWGVRYECLLTWYKPTAMPLWWMFNTEHILFGKIGALVPLKKGHPTGFQAPQQRHSHKPEQFFELVRAVSPERRLTMFDDARDGFEPWGVVHAAD